MKMAQVEREARSGAIYEASREASCGSETWGGAFGDCEFDQSSHRAFRRSYCALLLGDGHRGNVEPFGESGMAYL
jgi:hypothetical protein